MINLPASLRLIPDWPVLRRRYLAYWDQEVPDRSILVHIQNPNPRRPLAEPWMLEDGERKYLDPELFYRLQNWRRSSWNWHGDLFRYRIPSYGPNVFAGFAGAKPVFGRDTVWHEPIMQSLDEAGRVFFDDDNPFWRRHLKTVDFLAQTCAGAEHLAVTDFGGPADWIATFMGTERFLIATIEEPDRMREFAMRLAGECCRAFDLVQARITPYGDGTVNWMPVWSESTMMTVQDDIATCLSPSLYAEVFLPALRLMAGHCPHSILHWHDGSRQHLDIITTVPEVDVIQYGHDPNTGPFRDKLPDMQKIQAAGKRLFISCVEADDVKFFIRNLLPRGLMMIINTADDASSERMQEQVVHWTGKRLAELGLSGNNESRIHHG